MSTTKGPPNFLYAVEFFMKFLVIALLITLFVFYIRMLINAAKTAQWGWFVVMLLFGFTSIFYRFIGYKDPATI